MKSANSPRLIAALCLITITPFIALSQLTYPIAGTGVTQCYGNTIPITCPANTTDAFYGQFHGTAPSYHNNADGTISDLNTGLMWVQSRGAKITWDSAFIMARQCNVGGYNDWRVPTIKELYSLMNFNGKSATTAAACIAYLDTSYFEMAYGNTAIGERVIDAQDWSATQYQGLTMAGDTTIFGVNFIDGRIKGYPKYQPPSHSVGQKMQIRYVRGNTAYGINNFTDNSNGTVTDNATGLMWAKSDDGTGMNWQSALAYAQTKNTQNYLGHNDWRLPNAKELQSILDYTRSLDVTNSPAINPVFNCTAITDEGGNTNYPFYWASTTHLDNMGGVYFAFGEALGYMKMPPNATYYTLVDVHGAGAQRSDPKTGSVTSYYLGTDQGGNSVYGLGPQGDVIRINNYVRLVRTLTTGTGINENYNDPSINIYPNPATNRLNVSIDENLEGAQLNIYNITGSLVQSTQLQIQNSEFEIQNLTPGVYIAEIITKEGSAMHRWVKM